jgi:hypothetical protein
MKSSTHLHAEQALAQLAAQLDHWHDHRATRWERILECLWQQAVALTTVLPLSRVTKCVRVSWQDLHRHCAAHNWTKSSLVSHLKIRLSASHEYSALTRLKAAWINASPRSGSLMRSTQYRPNSSGVSPIRRCVPCSTWIPSVPIEVEITSL